MQKTLKNWYIDVPELYHSISSFYKTRIISSRIINTHLKSYVWSNSADQAKITVGDQQVI